MNREDVVQINNGIFLSHKKNEVMPSAATRMDLDYLTKSVRKVHFVCVTWNLKEKDELVYKTQTIRLQDS